MPPLVSRREHRMPGVVPADVEIGDVEKLAAKYPDVAADLRAIKDSIREN
jgi:hypothetical protein